MKFRLALIGAAALLSGPAMAADNGFYLGGAIGMSDVAESSTNWAATGFAYKLTAGYEFMKYLAVEGGYWNAGSLDDKGLKIDLDGEDLVVIGKWPFADAFDVHARAGVAWWNAKGHGYGFHLSDSGSDFLWGFGVGYKFGDHLMFSGDWERAEIADTDRADLWTVSAAWKF